MTSEKAKEILRDIRYFNRLDMDTEKFQRFTALREKILSSINTRSSLLNKENVLGIWYLTNLTYDEGNPQIILRVNKDNPELKLGSPKRVYLHDEIFNIIFNDVNFDYDEQIDKSDEFIEGLQELLFSEIENGRVLTIYNKERE